MRIADGAVLRRVQSLVNQFGKQSRTQTGIQQLWIRALRELHQSTERAPAQQGGFLAASQTAHRRLTRAAELLASGDLDVLGYELVRDEIGKALHAAGAREVGTPSIGYVPGVSQTYLPRNLSGNARWQTPTCRHYERSCRAS